MARLFLALLVGLLGAAIVHIAVVFTIPSVAGNNAWGRLSRLGALYGVVRIDSLRSQGRMATGEAADPETHDFAFVDPAFVTTSCRFSLDDGPVRLFAAGQTDFWSASIYSRSGDNLYSINDRSVVSGAFDLLVGTKEQLVEMRANSASADETSIPVEVDLVEGYLTLRVLVGEESQRPDVDAFVRSVVCAPSGLSDPEADEAPGAD